MADVHHSLYVWKNDIKIVFVTINVDDLITRGDSLVNVDHVEGFLKQEFDMKDLGELHYFLGIEVIHTNEGIWLSQRKYALDIFSKYNMAHYKPISMPID